MERKTFKFDEKELELLGDGLIALKNNASEAEKLCSCWAMQVAVDEQLARIQALLERICG